MSIFYDLVTENELEAAHRIESQGYPEDEAGSLDTFRYRQSQAPELFLGTYLSGPGGNGRTLIGYVCSTLSPGTTLTHESMSKHVPDSKSVCIHSICVALEHRKKSVGLNLVKEYVRRMAETGKYNRILLIAHEELRDFYERAGFEWVGQSTVIHGARPWFEMNVDLSSIGTTSPPTDPLPQGQALPAGLWEALARSSTGTRPVPRLLTSFGHAIEEIIDSDATGGSPTNKFDLLCPRLGCGSVILKSGVARWIERASVQLEPSGSTIPECLGALPVPPATAQWWLVTPNAMVFDNIGFSRPVQVTGAPSHKLKLLACAECDLGPLGWCEEGGSEFWLAFNRVGYRA